MEFEVDELDAVNLISNAREHLESLELMVKLIQKKSGSNEVAKVYLELKVLLERYLVVNDD